MHRNLNKLHINNHIFRISNRDNGAHAGCTTFKIVHPVFKSCTQVKGAPLSLYSTRTQNHLRWVLLRHLTQKIVLLRYLTQETPFPVEYRSLSHSLKYCNQKLTLLCFSHSDKKPGLLAHRSSERARRGKISKGIQRLWSLIPVENKGTNSKEVGQRNGPTSGFMPIINKEIVNTCELGNTFQLTAQLRLFYGPTRAKFPPPFSFLGKL